MVTKKKLEADLAAANEALEAEKQKSAAAAKAHDDKVKELSGKVKELEAAAAASTKESASAVADAKAAGAKEAEQALQKTLDDVRSQLEAATKRADALEAAKASAESLLSADDSGDAAAIAEAQAALAAAREELASVQQSSAAEIAALTSELEQARQSGGEADQSEALTALANELEQERSARQSLADEAAELRAQAAQPRADEGETAKLKAEINRERSRAERAARTLDAERRKTQDAERKLRETVTRRQADDEQDRRRNGVRARAWARASQAMTSRKADDAKQASAAVAAAGGLAARLAAFGAGLARAGELDVAERLYGEAAQLRGTIYGGPHAEEAQSLRQLAAHCRERDDLEQALEYMDRSCAAYSSSLRAGEGADVIAEPTTRLPPLNSVARHASLPRIEPETPPSPIELPEDFL